MTTDQLITDIIRREVAPEEQGRPWAEVKARKHVADRGGYTRAGVTAASWGSYATLGRPATPEELNALSEEQVRTFYRTQYVKPFEAVPDPLRALLADWAVTSGHDDPTKALQASLFKSGLYHGTIDGIFGPLTKAAVTADVSPGLTYRDVLAARVQFYQRLALRGADVRAFLQTHPRSQLHFIAGWTNRCLEFIL